MHVLSHWPYHVRSHRLRWERPRRYVLHRIWRYPTQTVFSEKYPWRRQILDWPRDAIMPSASHQKRICLLWWWRCQFLCWNFANALRAKGFLVANVNAHDAKKQRENLQASTDRIDLMKMSPPCSFHCSTILSITDAWRKTLIKGIVVDVLGLITASRCFMPSGENEVRITCLFGDYENSLTNSLAFFLPDRGQVSLTYATFEKRIAWSEGYLWRCFPGSRRQHPPVQCLHTSPSLGGGP